MLEFYLVMAALSAVYFYQINRPRGGEWVAYVGFVICWPLVLLWLVTHLIRRAFGKC